MQTASRMSQIPLRNSIGLSDPTMSLRPATALDDAFLIELNADERGIAYRGLGLPDSLVAQMLLSHLEAEIDAHAVQFPDAERMIICRDREPIGRLLVTLEIGDFGLCLHLIDLALIAGMRGTGHGRAILCSIVDSARAMRLARVTLKVFAANERAIKLFKRIGFRTQGGVDEGMNVTMAYVLP